jgi:hypothetical protein
MQAELSSLQIKPKVSDSSQIHCQYFTDYTNELTAVGVRSEECTAFYRQNTELGGSNLAWNKILVNKNTLTSHDIQGDKFQVATEANVSG